MIKKTFLASMFHMLKSAIREAKSHRAGGRPLLGERRRVQISISIDAETKQRLRLVAAKRGLSTGLLIDELAMSLSAAG